VVSNKSYCCDLEKNGRYKQKEYGFEAGKLAFSEAGWTTPSTEVCESNYKFTKKSFQSPYGSICD
jgi:hypothetical protein